MNFLFDTSIVSAQTKACRICLLMDVKMYSLQSSRLRDNYEDVSGIYVSATSELPMFLCYECISYVNKFSKFKEKCLIGQSTLYGILNQEGQITQQQIKNIDRKKLNLASNISVHHNTVEIQCHNDNFIEVEESKIKVEPIINDTNHITVDVNILKEEDLPDLGISSDDEPLFLHKSKEIKEKKKTRKKRESNEVNDNTDLNEQFDEDIHNIANEIELDADINELNNDAKPIKRKRGRPSKFKEILPKPPKNRKTKNTGGVILEDIDLEEYVDVITLSLEEQMEEINKRKESENYQNSIYKCNLCYKGFIDTKAWEHHVGKHDPSAGDVECPVCKFRFVNRRALQKHATNHEKKYSCKACSFVSKTTTQAKQHQRWHKGVTYSCQYCDEVSTKWTSYLSHVRIKHPSNHVCGICGYSFVSSLGLTMHKTMMHKDVKEADIGDESYCQECDVKFISLEAYNRHMVTSVKHAESKNFSRGCRVCGCTFSSSEELRSHHRSEHPVQRPKNYGRKPSNKNWPINCQHCNEAIENAQRYWVHFRRVHPDKPYPVQKNYVCDICGKSFKTNAFLTYHKRTHSEERLFACGACGKAFHNRHNLTLHQRAHSELRPHACDRCAKAFKCKTALDRHYRTHTGVKPYECEVCGKAFSQSNSRKLHVRTVHLKQPAPFINRKQERKKIKEQTPLPFIY